MTRPAVRRIGTGWKMNEILARARGFAEGLRGAHIGSGIRPFVIPPFTVLRDVNPFSPKTRSKNMHWAEKGTRTGEISATTLAGCGAEIVDLGHSERREHFGETDLTVGQKTEAAIRRRLIPPICIGETLAQRDAGRAKVAPLLPTRRPVAGIGVNGQPAGSDDAGARQAEIIAVTAEVPGRRIPCFTAARFIGATARD